MKRLTAAEVDALPGTLPEWRFDPQNGGSISRAFTFKDFGEAFGFMTQIALAAERMNHHPEWSNVYNRVSIRLTTHDVHAVSSNDVELARVVDRVYSSFARARA